MTGLREAVARVLCVSFYKDMAEPSFIPPESYTEEWLTEADAAIAATRAHDAREIELALGRITEVRARLGTGLPLETVVQMRNSLLAAIGALVALLPADEAKVWKAKRHE